MANGAHEGYPGMRIDEVRQLVRGHGYIEDRKPNLVLMHIGTNNCLQNRNYDTGASELADFAEEFFSRIPLVTIIMSTLGPLHDDAANDRCHNVLNPNIRAQVAKMQQAGKNVHLAEFAGPGYITKADIGADGVHPTAEGYGKYAEIWYDVIERLLQQGVIGPPAVTEYPDLSEVDNTCEKVAGHAFGPVDTQFGTAGLDDGPYSHSSARYGFITKGGAPFEYGSRANIAKHLMFAQLINPQNSNRDQIQEDLLFYSGGGDDHTKTTWGDGKFHAFVYQNLGSGTIGDRVDIDVDDGPAGCLVQGVRWGDVNNDGLDDYICIGQEGNMYVSINRGGIPPKFEYVGLYFQHQEGYDQSKVRLADIDGDGRLDYCVTADNGNISCWRNGGTTEDKARDWAPLGVVFTGKGMGDIAGTRFIDINGDHRSDWVWLYDTGKTRIFTNSRGPGKGMVPTWKEASASHAGTGDARDYIRFPKLFARLNGEKSRADYVRIGVSRVSSLPFYSHVFEIYENRGTGGTRVKADGNRYGDMTGSGRDDLLWIKSTGELTYWPNQNTAGHLASPWIWGYSYQVLNINGDGGFRDRRGVHLADWDGDGKCDVIYYEKFTGGAEWWRNTYVDGGRVSFTYMGRIGPDCTQGIGVGEFDLGLRFADVDGDGRADWLCMEPNGRTTGILNTASGLRDVGQVKISEGHERANLRWADVNGDGRADLLFANNINGDTSVYESGGADAAKPSGSFFRFTAKGIQYSGQTQSADQYYPDLDGDGRADLHYLDPNANTAKTFFNICPAGSGSGRDDPGMQNPDEPPLPQCDNYCTVFSCGDEDSDWFSDGGLKRDIVPRGNTRRIAIPDLTVILYVIGLAYPTLESYLRNTPGGPAHTLYYSAGQDCDDTDITQSNADVNGAISFPLPPEWGTTVELDHPFDLQTIGLFLSFAVTGRRASDRGPTNLPLLPLQTLINTWNSTQGLPPTAPGGRTVINDLVMNAYGSSSNQNVFVPLRRDINSMKGSVMGALLPQEYQNFEARVTRAAQGDIEAYRQITTTLHEVITVFNYINEAEVLRRFNDAIAGIRGALVFVQQNNLQWAGIVDLWDQWLDDHLHAVVQAAYDFVYDAIGIVSLHFEGVGGLLETTTLRLVARLQEQLTDIIIRGRATPDRRP